MRRLINHLERAQARHRAHGESGAVAVTTALALVVLLGFAAIAIDVGMVYEERAQLQNGADSAALAVAQTCIEHPAACSTPVSASVTDIAEDIARENTRDGLSDVAALTFPSASSVRVQTQASDGQAEAGKLALSIAPVLGVDDAAVSATATVAWGHPGTGPARIPIVVSLCQAVEGLKFPETRVVLDITDGDSASNCTHQGKGVPGGFSWFRQYDKARCGEELAIEKEVEKVVLSDPGNDFPASCDAVLAGLADGSLGDTLLLPVYDHSDDQGKKATYRLAGWVAFQVEGWHFKGGGKDADRAYNNSECSGNCRGLIGKFTRFAALDDEFTDDGPANFGASVVKFSG